MSEEFYSKFDEALHAQSVVTGNADHHRAAAAAVRSVRTRRRQRAVVVSAVALVAVPALAFGAYALTSIDDVGPMVSPSPGPTLSQSPAPSTTPSQVAPTPEVSSEPAAETWDEVEKADRPPFLADLHSDLPRARAMEDWVWQYVDNDWKLETRTSGEPGSLNAQGLFLFAPDGDVLHLFTLRIDVVLAVGHWDVDQQIAWLERHEGGDGFLVVQMDLRDGSLERDWAGGAEPHGSWTEDGLLSLRYIGDAPSGPEVWALVTYFAPSMPVMLRDAEGRFSPSPAMDWFEQRTAEGLRDRNGNAMAESWVADDFSTAVYAVLEAEWTQQDGWIRGDSRWLWHDLDSGAVREVEPRLPAGQACWARGGPTGEETGQTVDERVVAECEGGIYLIDPTGNRAPEPYSG